MQLSFGEYNFSALLPMHLKPASIVSKPEILLLSPPPKLKTLFQKLSLDKFPLTSSFTILAISKPLSSAVDHSRGSLNVVWNIKPSFLFAAIISK